MKTFALKVTLPRKYDTLQIEPISDVHRDDVNFVESKWREVIGRIKSEPNRYTIGMGDYGSQLYSGDKRGTTTVSPEFRDNPMLLHRTLVDELSPIKQKILLMLQGNHDLTVEKNMHINPLEEFLTKPLNVPYGGYVSLVRLTVTNGEYTQKWSLYLTHGRYTGRQSAGAVTRLIEMSEGFDADVYLMGDRHDIEAAKRVIYGVNDKGELVAYNRIYGLCGCFVAGYSEEALPTSYPETIMGLPNKVGTLTIQLNLKDGKIYVHE